MARAGLRILSRLSSPACPILPSHTAQTISIAKAGITTTLNARAAVLAAANPAWGRWDARRTPSENIALPAALLSRFDLLWLILDKADEEGDTALARHVLHVHAKGQPPALGFEPLDGAALRAYVAMARRYDPCFPPALAEYVASAYAEMRAEEEAADAMSRHSYTMARTLLSILRLAQAMARLRFADEVGVKQGRRPPLACRARPPFPASPPPTSCLPAGTPHARLNPFLSSFPRPQVIQSDVDESLRLMRMSKASLDEPHGGARGKAAADPVSEAYAVIRDYVATHVSGRRGGGDARAVL